MASLGESIREARRTKARAVAEPLGLDVDERARIHGTLHGVPLRRYSKDHGGKNHTVWWTHTDFELAMPLPGFMVARNKNLLDALSEALGTRDIQLGNDLDAPLWIRAAKRREGAVRRLLTDPEVEPALRAVVEAGMRLGLEKRRLTLLVRGHHLEVGDVGLREGAALARALNASMRAPWAALADEPYVTVAADGRSAEGHYRGVPIRIQVKEDQGLRTLFLAWIDPPLPPGTEVAHRDQLASNQEFNDPVLDPMLSVISSDLAAACQRLCADAARGPLLEVLHGHPRSRLRADRVGLVVPGHVGVDLYRYLDLVADLVHAIGGARRPGG